MVEERRADRQEGGWTVVRAGDWLKFGNTGPGEAKVS